MRSNSLPSTEVMQRSIPSAQLATLLRVSSALTESLELPRVLQVAVDGAVEVLGLDTGAVYVLEGDMLCLGATTPPLPADFPRQFRYAPLLDHPHIGACMDTGDPVFVPDTSDMDMTEAERGVVEARGLKSLLYVPLVGDHRAVGTMILGTTEDVHVFEGPDVDLCKTLSSQVSLAVVNSQLFDSVRDANEELRRAYDATLEGWSTTLEMRDAGTGSHTRRAVEMTLDLAMRMGIPHEEIAHVRRGALLHDIGKMVVPDSILNEPGPLTEDEWSIMREHPGKAREMLERIDFLVPALDIPYCHHERWDGGGYPRGLAGEDIPLSARVFAVVDVYEALTSDRPYRAAWTHDAAVEHIRAEAGAQFDPSVVDHFLRLIG